MPRLTDDTSYAGAQRHASPAIQWDHFDGSRGRLSTASECIDRHAHDEAMVAIRLDFSDGHGEVLRFPNIADLSGRFADWLVGTGVRPVTGSPSCWRRRSLSTWHRSGP